MQIIDSGWIIPSSPERVGRRTSFRPKSDLDFPRFHILHGVGRVQEQVHEHLLEVPRVQQNQRAFIIEFPRVFYSSEAALIFQELANTLDDLIDSNRRDLVGLGSGKIEKSSHDAVDPLRL